MITEGQDSCRLAQATAGGGQASRLEFSQRFVATSAEKRWPPVGNSVAARENPMAIDRSEWASLPYSARARRPTKRAFRSPLRPQSGPAERENDGPSRQSERPFHSYTFCADGRLLTALG